VVDAKDLFASKIKQTFVWASLLDDAILCPCGGKQENMITRKEGRMTIVPLILQKENFVLKKIQKNLR
jgi:hypothetical protein